VGWTRWSEHPGGAHGEHGEVGGVGPGAAGVLARLEDAAAARDHVRDMEVTMAGTLKDG